MKSKPTPGALTAASFTAQCTCKRPRMARGLHWRSLMFRKRHFEAIATVMQEAHPGAGLSDNNRAVIQWSETCKDLAEMFSRKNGKFDIIRFMRACKPGANVKAKG